MGELERSPAPWVDKMTEANRLLAEVADDPFRASRVWDFAEAARVYAIQVNLGVEAVNHAVAVKLKAQRLMAEAVDKGQAEGRIATRRATLKRGDKGAGQPDPRGSGIGNPRTLDEIGVTSQRVSEARRIRDAFTDEDIDTAAADATIAGEELSSATMLARARDAARRREAGETGEDRRARSVREFMGCPLGRLVRFDPAAIAGLLTDAETQRLRDSIAELDRWMARFEDAREARAQDARAVAEVEDGDDAG